MEKWLTSSPLPALLRTSASCRRVAPVSLVSSDLRSDSYLNSFMRNSPIYLFVFLTTGGLYVSGINLKCVTHPESPAVHTVSTTRVHRDAYCTLAYAHINRQEGQAAVPESCRGTLNRKECSLLSQWNAILSAPIVIWRTYTHFHFSQPCFF